MIYLVEIVEVSNGGQANEYMGSICCDMRMGNQ